MDAEYEKVWSSLKEQSVEGLIDLPLMTDRDVRAAMRVLASLTGPSLYTDINLYHLHFCKMVNLSLRYGISDASTFGLVGFGAILCQPFRRYNDGYRFAKLACDLVEKHGFAAYRSKVYLSMEMVALWSQPIEVGVQFIRTALRAGAESGDLSYACFSCMHLITDLLSQGAPLNEVWRESETCLDLVRRSKYLDAADAIISQRQLIRNLQGQTADFSTFSDESFDEESFEAGLTEDRMTAMVSRYWILKIQARFMSGDYGVGLAAAARAKRVHWSSEAFFHSLDYYYYTALTMAASYDNASTDEQQEWRAVLSAHVEQLREWADNFPQTFADKYSLVAAEVARLERHDADAMRLYEQAIRSANQNGFAQNEGVAYEVAARFYAARGFDTIANAYLRNARNCYIRWGAHGKVKQLDRIYPRLASADGYRPTGTIGSPVQQLDIETVVKASQAVSREIVLPKLIERLMTIALENAGADRGLLILPGRNDPFVEAEAQAIGARIEVVQCQKPISEIACPETIVHYAIRTHQSVVLGDCSRPTLFSEDDYLRSGRAKSLLCLPLINQTQLRGLLYLENTLTSHAFAPDRIAILEVIAGQAAISLENTRLYNDLQEREAKIRRLVDANIIGICIWDFEGQILDANDAFLRMVGYDRQDLASGRIRWTSLTPPEWRAHDARAIEERKLTGTAQPFEKEYLRKDGNRVPVLIGVAAFEGSGSQGVAFVLDLSERKRAEAEAREIERRFSELQSELAHANRLATMGQLTASIAHEVKQPISATVTNAQAALRFLDLQPVDLDEIREIFDDIVKDGERAGAVFDRIRYLSKKAPSRKDWFELNVAIREVIELTRGEAAKSCVSMQVQLAEGLPLVEADRVQLQQVVLNLIINAIQAMSGIPSDIRTLSVSSENIESEGVRVAVSDSGPGLSPDGVERLFEPFYTTKPDGMGMGLSICRSIIEGHGGRLWASPNTGPGATFQFTLPYVEQDA